MTRRQRQYRIWLKGRPDRYVDWNGFAPQEAAIGGLVNLLTSEERRALPADTVVVAQLSFSMTINDIDRWIDKMPEQMEHEKSLKDLQRRHLHGTF